MAGRTRGLVALTIYLMKPDATEADAIDQSAQGISVCDIEQDSKKIGTLHVRQTPLHPPHWARFFAGQSKVRFANLKNAAASAVLLIRAKKRLFAVVFGYGRHLLNSANIEVRFGLRVTLNCIDPGLIRAVDTTSLESNPLHGRRQASKATSLHDFGIDFDRDLLRAATGKPGIEALGSTMSGADALMVRVAADLRGLQKLLSKYLDLERKSTYRQQGFGWVDHVAEVRDVARVHGLHMQLVDAIRSRSEGTRIWAAIPEAIDWMAFDSFRIGSLRKSRNYSDISLDSLVAALGEEKYSIESLRRKSVFCVARDGESVLHEWSFLRCIGAEINHRDELFLLNAGTWYRIANNFVAEIDQYVDRISESDVSLAPWGDETEAAYNLRMAKQSRGTLIHMDRRLVRHAGMSSPVEFCDLLSRDGKLLHVKRYGQSGVLSHLFSQGAVSASLLVGDPAFRKAVNDLLEEPLFVDPEASIDRSRFEVCFVVGSSSVGRVKLPFFSKVTLRNAHRTITTLGLRASVKTVRVDKLTNTIGAPQLA